MRANLQGLSERELVARVQATGAREAYGVLIRRHQAALRAFLWRLAGSASAADDLAQETLIRAYDRIALFRGGSAFRTWLFAIAYREFLRGRRKAAVYARILSQSEAREEAVAGDPDLGLDLQRCLSALSDVERAALLLCDACGMSHSEAAEAMGVPLGSAKTYVARARDKMRAALGAEADDPVQEEVPCRIAR